MAEINNNKPRCDYDQYALLLMCSEIQDISPWNNWREENPQKEVWLERADFSDAYLKGAHLYTAHIDEADFSRANLTGAKFPYSELRRTAFWDAHFEEVLFSCTDLEGAIFHGTHLERTSFNFAHLKRSSFFQAHLKEAEFNKASLDWVHFDHSHLEGTIFYLANVDGKTVITECTFDKETDFSAVGLDAATIDPGLKESLKNNIRRIQWQKWMKTGNRFRKVIKHILCYPFWWLTDFGSSTARIIFAFFTFTVLFGCVYFVFETIPGLHGIVSNLRINSEAGNWHVLWRAIYFSIVTMTTLGFGDMHAADRTDIWGLLGCILLSLQVIVGYVLLGALITRLGILFSGVGPAQKLKGSNLDL